MIWAVLLVPSVAGLLAMLIPMRSAPRWLLMTAAAAHTTLAAGLWVCPSPASHWIAADLPGRLFLTITSVLFLAMAFYTIGYLRRAFFSGHHEPGHPQPAPRTALDRR